MKKVISLFKRDYEGTRLVYNEIVPGAEWVQAGEGIATIKIDGTSCLIENGKIYKRYDVKKGRAVPNGFIPAQDPDPMTGHWPGWVEILRNDPSDQWHVEAFDNQNINTIYDGTYELIGPKVQGNPYNLSQHELVKHGSWSFREDPPRTFDELKEFFSQNPIYEGIVWHHPNGDMVKIKRRDFGLLWPIPEDKK